MRGNNPSPMMMAASVAAAEDVKMPDTKPLDKKTEPIIFSKKDFGPNDLAYGTREARGIAMSLAGIDGFYARWTIDAYNNRLLKTPVFGERVAELYDFDRFSMKFNRFQYSNFSLAYDAQAFELFIKNHCKYGILWTVSRGGTIHFFLDDRFDFSVCFNKTKPFYTASELRFVYRHWNELAPLNQIRFWKQCNDDKFQEMPAPWVTNPEIAQNYKPKNSRKDLYAKFFQELNQKKTNEDAKKSSVEKRKAEVELDKTEDRVAKKAKKEGADNNMELDDAPLGKYAGCNVM